MSLIFTIRDVVVTERAVVAAIGADPLPGFQGCSTADVLRELTCTFENLADGKAHCSSPALLATYRRLEELGIDWRAFPHAELDSFCSDEK